MSVDIRSSHADVSFVKLSGDISLESFVSKIEEYTEFLKKDALQYQEFLVTNTYLLLNRKTASILAYMSVIADSITLTPKERDGHGFDFLTIPALKIAKLATNKNTDDAYNHVGTFMVEIAKGMAMESNTKNMACRFITVDADVEHNPGVCEFYKKALFVPNEDTRYTEKTKTISMRRDLFASS
jgi:hypothetical protein